MEPNTKTPRSIPKKRVYILSETMRSAKSGFFIEGTDIEMDFPDEYPLPLSTEVLEDGRPVSLRIIPFCDSIEVAEQMKRGFAMDQKYNDSDRTKLTFKFGRLELDEERDKNYIGYIERAAWFRGNEEKKRFLNTKTIYELYDEDRLLETEIDNEAAIVKAKGVVLGLEDGGIRDLYKLAVGGNYKETNTTFRQMKRHLLNVAENNASFIIDGVKAGRDEAVVALNKGLEYKIASLDYAGMASIKGATGEMEPWIDASDAGGRENKFNRVVDYLVTVEGKIELATLKDQIAKYEDSI